jgi:prepilin peptidase CpaA
MMIDATRLLLFPTLMAFAASSDLLTMTISNKVSLALAAGFLVLAPAAGLGVGEIGMHAAAGFAALAVAFCLFACGWIGGGDAKLAAATALWLGFDQLLPYLFVASLLGGVLTLLVVQFQLFPLPMVRARAGQSGCTARMPACPTASRSPPPRSSSTRTRYGCTS